MSSESKLFIAMASKNGEIMHDGTIIYDDNLYTDMGDLVPKMAGLLSRRAGSSYYSKLVFYESDNLEYVVTYDDLCSFGPIGDTCGQKKIKNIYDLLKGKVGDVIQIINQNKIDSENKLKKDSEDQFYQLFDPFIEYADNIDMDAKENEWLTDRRMEIVQKLLAITNAIAHGTKYMY